MNTESAEDEAPDPQQFADQLIHQVLADLGGILLDGTSSGGDAFPLIRAQAEIGHPRGALLPLMARACLTAQRALINGSDGDFDWDGDAPDGVDEILGHLAPMALSRRVALYGHESRIATLVTLAEQSRSTLQGALSRAIFRLYDGMRRDDESIAGSGLLELRSMVVHFDAVAQSDSGDGLQSPARIVRPDRFHDYFMRFVDRAQSADPAGEERAIAALSRDGRIEALIAEDRAHPVRLATDEVRAAVVGDGSLKDHVIIRIRALIVFLGTLRRTPSPEIGDPRSETPAYLSLVVAAATSPLSIGGEFARGPLLQIARYNLSLLRIGRHLEGTAH